MSDGNDLAPPVPEIFTADQVAEIRREADRRVMLAELKVGAQAAGMVDLDALRLLDLSAVTVTPAGDVSIPDGFFEAARKSKPYLFRSAASAAGSTARAPQAVPPRARNAVEMEWGEWQAARAALLKRL